MSDDTQPRSREGLSGVGTIRKWWSYKFRGDFVGGRQRKPVYAWHPIEFKLFGRKSMVLLLFFIVVLLVQSISFFLGDTAIFCLTYFCLPSSPVTAERF